MTVQIEVSQFGKFFATRHRAAEIRTIVEQVLAAEPDDALLLDFEGVEAVTGGFADELVAQLRHRHGNRICWDGANESVADTILEALARRAGTA